MVVILHRFDKDVSPLFCSLFDYFLYYTMLVIQQYVVILLEFLLSTDRWVTPALANVLWLYCSTVFTITCISLSLCENADVLFHYWLNWDILYKVARSLFLFSQIMKSEVMRINHELQAQKEKIKENTEKIKVNKTLPYLVSNVIEVRSLSYFKLKW